MKTFAYIRLNPEAKCEKENIVIFRIKNNVPARLATITRGYRDAQQAVIQFLTDSGQMRSPRPDEMRFTESERYFKNRIDLKLLAKVQILEM